MAATSVLKLVVDDKDYGASLKSAKQGMKALEESLKAAGKSFKDCDAKVAEYARAIGQMDTDNKSARGRVAELSSAFVELSSTYKHLSEEVKQSDVGRGLSASLEQLKQRTIEAKREFESINAELGDVRGGAMDFNSVLGQVSGKLGVNGDLMKAVTSGTVAYTAAIGAAVTGTIAATKAFADYNSELSKQTQVTTVTTGLSGPDADRMTAMARSVSKVYGTDFREVINAANTLMTQFGRSGDQAMQLIRDGMQGMIQGDGPKLLQMIKQFAPAFRDAGISASQLVAIIHNSEGGLFSDENMNAILMGIKNIRNMTDQTAKDLANLGINGEEMSRKMSDGSMTVFQALQQVSTALENANSGSKEAGRVMQDVFGRQGAMQGMKLSRAISELNTNLDETKNQTGEVGKKFSELEKANERLEAGLIATFGYKGWQEMATGIETELVKALADVLELTDEIKNSWVGKIGNTIFDTVAKKIETSIALARTLLTLYSSIGKAVLGGNDEEKHGSGTLPVNVRGVGPNKILQGYKSTYGSAIPEEKGSTGAESPLEDIEDDADGATDAIGDTTKKVAELMDKLHELETKRKGAVMSGSSAQVEGYNKEIQKLRKDIITLDPNAFKKKTTATAPKVEQTEIQKNQKQIEVLTKEYQELANSEKTASSESVKQITERKTAIIEEIKQYQIRNKELQRWADEAQGKKTKATAPGSLPAMAQQLQELKKAQSEATTGEEYRRLGKEIDDVTRRIAIMKGELPKGEEAIITISVDADNIADIAEALNDAEEKTMQVRVDYDNNPLEDIPSEKTVTINYEVGDLQDIDDEDRTVTFIADDTDVMAKVREIQGAKIDEKTLTITATTAEAVNAIKAIDGIKIKPKYVQVEAVAPNPVDVTVNKPAPVQVEAVAPNPVDVTVNKPAPVQVEAVAPNPVDVKVNAPEDVKVKADVSDVLTKMESIKGITIDPKKLVFTADDVEALKAAAEVNGVKIDEKAMKVTPETAEAAKQLSVINGIALDPKTLVITVTTQNADALKELENQLDTIGTNYTLTFNKVEVDKKAFTETNLNSQVSELKKKLSTETYGSEQYTQTQMQVADATAVQNILQTAIKNGMDVSTLNPNDLWTKILGSDDIAVSELQSRIDAINTFLKDNGIEPIKLNFETGEVSKEGKGDDNTMEKVNKAVSGVSSVVSGLQSMGITMSDDVKNVIGVIQGAMQVIQGIQTVISVFGATTMATNTAMLGANTAAMTAMTTALWTNTAAGFIPFLSSGGMNKNGKVIHAAIGTVVPGNYGFDAVPAMLTSGEVVLNRAEIGNIASQLEGNHFGDIEITGTIYGEDIRLSQRRNSLRRGKGEYITSKMRD